MALLRRTNKLAPALSGHSPCVNESDAALGLARCAWLLRAWLDCYLRTASHVRRCLPPGDAIAVGKRIRSETRDRFFALPTGS